MSDLAAAAAALGVPEAIVQRSAAARASETGMSVDEVLAAWAGGDAPAAPAPAPATASEPATTPEEATSEEAPVEEPAPVVEETAAPSPAVETAPTPVPAPPVAPAAPGKPPVLIGASDRPMTTLLGAVGLFLAVFLVGLVGPSIPGDNPGARTSVISFSETAQRGREVYASLGCAACHTQMVRPVTADVGLGAVTLDDSNQVLGIRRFGPDLSDIGSRLSASQIEAIIGGFGDHPSQILSTSDLSDLVTYLVESQTGSGAGS